MGIVENINSPNTQETIDFIGKNYHEQSQTIFTNINHEIGQGLVQTKLEQITKNHLI